MCFWWLHVSSVSLSRYSTIAKNMLSILWTRENSWQRLKNTHNGYHWGMKWSGRNHTNSCQLRLSNKPWSECFTRHQNIWTSMKSWSFYQTEVDQDQFNTCFMSSNNSSNNLPKSSCLKRARKTPQTMKLTCILPTTSNKKEGIGCVWRCNRVPIVKLTSDTTTLQYQCHSRWTRGQPTKSHQLDRGSWERCCLRNSWSCSSS